MSGWSSVNCVLTKSETEVALDYLQRRNHKGEKVFQLEQKDYVQGFIKKVLTRFSEEIEGINAYRNIELSKIWYVSTTEENSKPNELPYIPHFDKLRFLKIMVYLNDVSEADGPFTTASHSPSIYDSRRLQLPDDYKELGLNSVSEEYEYTEFLARKGDAVIFDTNVAHFAKPVSAGGLRRVLRFDFEDFTWNKPFKSRFSRIKRVFGS